MYTAVLIAPDGDWVTDFERNSVREVWDCVSDMGSRWIFYPLPVVVQTDNGSVSLDQRIASVGDEIGGLADYVLAELSELIDDVKGGELAYVFDMHHGL